MIDHVLDRLLPGGQIDDVYVVTNAKFTPHFEAWAKASRAQRTGVRLHVVNDRSTDEQNRLGAIGDLHLVLNREGIDDDVIVVAGDNLFSQNLDGFCAACSQSAGPVLGIYDVGSREAAKKYGVVALDANGVIQQFVEKPAEPPSSLIGIALYFYPRTTLPLIRQYISEGNNPDQPGRLVQWLYPRLPVRTWRVPGLWFDIGSKETLEEADRVFSKQ